MSRSQDATAHASDATGTRTRLRHVHLLVLAVTLGITFFAAVLVSNRSEAQAEKAFETEAERTVGLIVNRLERYEIGLSAGVGLIETIDPDQPLDRAEWVRFTDNLDLVEKYPGINGIGVIYRVTDEDVDDYIERFADDYPELAEFGPKPPVDADVHFPITFIEPFLGNEQAVGLDMAFETNRLEGARAALETDTARITGPIVLVQDENQTPGFLFFSPFGSGDESEQAGLVYAPFVARRLMDGVLSSEQRDVAISITDDDTVLYADDEDARPDRDPEPLFSKRFDVDVYGRTWSFDVSSNQAFRIRAATLEPVIILFGGLLINAMLFGLFFSNIRARQRTADYADEVTAELRDTLGRLEATNHDLQLTNQDLEQFAFVASHDLQTPMRTVSNYASLLNEELGEQLDDDRLRYLDSLTKASDRMQVMIKSMLDYAMLSRTQADELVDLQVVIDEILGEVEAEARGARIHVGPLPVVLGTRDGLTIAFRNVIANALKYRRDHVVPELTISATDDGTTSRISVSDNGIGIDESQRAKIFQIFYRLNPADKYDGTGIGLAMCKRIVEALGGSIEVATNRGGGTTFTLVLSTATPTTTRVADSPDDLAELSDPEIVRAGN